MMYNLGLGKNFGLMEQLLLVLIRKVKKRAVENFVGLMVVLIMVTSNLEDLMVKAHINGQMVINT